MCGLAGWAGDVEADADALRRMCEVLRHRGPDDEGFLHRPGRAFLGFRRLSVIDLHTGNQPILSEDGSIAVTCNGEIYNFRPLRDELLARGHTFRTGSDAEVVVHLYEELGVECLQRLTGMFAIAVWDERADRLMLAVDRMGVKPLYWAPLGGGLVYGSEPAAILASGLIDARPDPAAIMDFLAVQYVPAPLSGFEGIRKLAPGERLVFERGATRVEPWWSLPDGPRATGISEEEALEQVDECLREATRSRLVSDVPLGAFLSGGVDSSLVVSYMAELSDRVKTFSVDVPVHGYSEGEHSRAVARAFSTDHHELVVEPEMVRESVEAISAIGEPFADSSAVPTHQLSGLARESVTVALAGDGGDEAFGGYARYQRMAQLDRWEGAGRRAGALLPESALERFRRAHNWIELLAKSRHERYAEWMTIFAPSQLERLCRPEFIAAAGGTRRAWDELLALPAGEGVAPYARLDTLTYLPGDLLVKVDRMSMAHSLEVRSPFLDHRLQELATRLPPGFKLRNGVAKWLLRKLALRRGIPASVIDRPKMGFSIPIGRWMKASLKEWVEDLVLSDQARAREHFVEAEVRRLVADHVEGRADHEARLWSLAMLELWHREWIDRPVASGHVVGVSGGRYAPP
ncbi:MAG: asparagine synthase (glutamine-hydrolyzing) [Actinomycetota bacterium]